MKTMRKVDLLTFILAASALPFESTLLDLTWKDWIIVAALLISFVSFVWGEE